MNIFGEALDGLGRWYVAVPPFLIVGFLAALFFLTGAGQERLREASDRLQTSAWRERCIESVDANINQAQSGLRGYLLTEDKRYLTPYKLALADMEARVQRLSVAYGSEEVETSGIRSLQGLIGKKQSEWGVSLALHDGQEPARALQYMKTNVGEDTSAEIAAIIQAMRIHEAQAHSAARTHWELALRLSRWITAAGTVFNMLLVGIAARLVYMDLRRRTLQTAELRGEKHQLEREALDRTRELVELSTHLQSVSEHEKAALARELHDELGGLLVGARMDVSWAEQHLAQDDAAMKHRLNRVQQNLSAGIDLKRRVIEELRPTLLDNVGLFAALRWQMKETCGVAGLTCSEFFPDEEPPINSEAAIALFRIAQEAFTNILKHAQAKSVDITLDLDDDIVMMRICDDGIGIPAERFKAVGSHGLASMRHRVRALEGHFEVTRPAAGGTLLIVKIPAAKALKNTAETQRI